MIPDQNTNFNSDTMESIITELMIDAGVPEANNGALGATVRNASKMICGSAAVLNNPYRCIFDVSGKNYTSYDTRAQLVSEYLKYLGAPTTDPAALGFFGWIVKESFLQSASCS